MTPNESASETSHPILALLGYTFTNHQLFQQALTHPSLAYETQERQGNNQRLEFLGDAALQLGLSALLYENFPLADEGTLTRMRATLVSTDFLANLAREMDIGPHLRMGKGEAAGGGRNRDSALADALEAILGAIYLDGGAEASCRIIRKLFHEAVDLAPVGLEHQATNPKGRLQELIQRHTSVLPTYEIVSAEGPPHQRSFTARVIWQGTILGSGTGVTKKQAEILAAQAALNSEIVLKLTQQPS
jgi:ribonuclease III